MATTCFCGCGREIKGIRRKANNVLARQMSDELAALRGVLARSEAGGRADEVAALADEGTDLLGQVTAYLHGDAERDDLDKTANTAWLDRATKARAEVVASAAGPPWEPDDPRTSSLAATGTRAAGVVTDVRRDGWGNERVADLAMTVSVQPADTPAFDVTRKLSIAVIKVPRVGDRVEVAYDPADPNRFVYRPRLPDE